MDSIIQTYDVSISALGYVAVLMLIQVLVSDVVGISRKHTPGTSVDGDHSDLLFRVSRTVSNTNETVAIFIAALLFCILSSASPSLTGYAAWGYAISRTLYAGCYYGNLQVLRSICFGFSLLALAFLIGVGFVTG